MIDETRKPPAYDWFEIDNGYTLKLSKDGSFTYTKYKECTTGTYVFDLKLSKIEFHFDCEIELYGEKINKITEYLEEDNKQNNQLYLEHAYTSVRCETNCSSFFKRIE